ncbi:MAG: Gldg family protein [Alphaproteobacteria bacterium]
MSVINWVQTASRTTIAISAIVMALVLFLSINLVASLTIVGTRLDVTEQKLYTLSEETRDTVDAIQEPITLRLYLSSALVNDEPTIRLHSERVIELLKTYELLSGGMIDFQQVDPVSLSVEEDEALGLGIAPLPLSINDKAYFGLVATNTLDNIEVIPFLSPTENAALEYDLTRILARISAIDLPAIGILSGLSLVEGEGGPSAFFERLREEFRVEELPADINNIPALIDVLILIHPYVLLEPTRYAVDQYVINGGKVLVLLDNLAEMGPPNPQSPNLLRFPESRMSPVLEAWGVDMIEDLVVGDPETARRVQSNDGRQFRWLERFDAVGFNQDDVVTSSLSSVLFVSPASFSQMADATTVFTSLVTTSAVAGLIAQGAAMQGDPTVSRQAFVPAGEQVIAVRITGTVNTAFPDGPPEQAEGMDMLPPELTSQSVAPVDIIVIGDTDFIANDFFNGQFSSGTSNAVFVLNAVEQLAGAADLTELRARRAQNRPFTRIDDMFADANLKYAGRIAELTDQYNNLNLRIADLLSRTPLGQPAGLSTDLRAQYDDMIAEQLRAQRERRDLQALVREEFETLRTNLRLINILVVPGIVILFGILVAFWRRARLARYLRGRQRPA